MASCRPQHTTPQSLASKSTHGPQIHYTARIDLSWGELVTALISTLGARAGIGVFPNAFVATDPASVGWVDSRASAILGSPSSSCSTVMRLRFPPTVTCARRMGPNMASRELQELFSALRSGDPQAGRVAGRLLPFRKRTWVEGY
jgi:hypothetical protein